MKKLLFLVAFIPTLVFGQQNLYQVLGIGNDAKGRGLVGTSLIGLKGATSGTVTVMPPAIVTTYTFTLPANDGAASQYLQTDGSGVTSWQTVSTVSTGLTVGSTAIASGTSGYALYDNAGTLGNKLVWDGLGNSGTSAATNFIGTTDAVNFRIQRNGLVGAVFKSSGDIFIGNKGSQYMYFDYANARLGINDSTPARIFVLNGEGANNYPRLNTDASHQILLEFAVGGSGKGYLGVDGNTPNYICFMNPTTGNKTLRFNAADDSIVSPYTLSVNNIISLHKIINVTTGDAATIDAMAGRFRKDNSGTTFTLTNNKITANSIIILQAATTGITSGYDMVVVAGAGSAVITFQTIGVAQAPSADYDVNFIIIN